MVGASRDAGSAVWVVDPSLFTLPYDHELCQALTDAGHRVRLVARRLRRLETTVSEARYRFDPMFFRGTEGGRLQFIPGPIRSVAKGVEHWSGMCGLAGRVRREKPDVVHFQWLPLPLVDRRLLAGMADHATLVLTVHDATSQAGRGFSKIQRLGWAGALRAFGRLVVHTEAGREALVAQGVGRRSVAVIPHPPLPLPGFQPVRRASEVVLMVFGEIKPYKGIDIAIEALSQLPESLQKTVRLVVAGRPRMPLGPLKDLARTRGVEDRVEWIDRYIPLGELPDVLAAATLFLLPYREADASGVLSQILQLGRPIVASRTGDFPDLVAGGGCGLVVEPGDAAALAGAVAGILDDPEAADEMGRRAHRLWLTMPSWADVAEQLCEIYRDLPPPPG